MDQKESKFSFLLKDQEKDQKYTEKQMKRSGLTSEELELLRRSVPLKIDPKGRWWHDGERFTHKRLITLFNQGIDWHEGESILRVGDRWCYIESDLTPFLVLKLEVCDEGGIFEESLTSNRTKHPTLYALLNNEERHLLTDVSLKGEILFAQLTPKRLARFSRYAQDQCAQWLEVDSKGRYFLKWREHIWPIDQEE